MKYLWHVTLNTGHGRRSPRSEAVDEVLRLLHPLIQRALRERIELPGDLGASISAVVVGGNLVATIWDDKRDAPLATIGVASRSRSAARLWKMLHNSRSGLVTDPADVPGPPWLAVVTEPALTQRLDAAMWLADFERCIAWAWLEGGYG